MKFIKAKNLTPAQQLYGLKSLFKEGKGRVKKNRLNWICTIRPTPISRDYTIRIVYKLHSIPSVFVLKPSLKELSGGRSIPHLYSEKEEELCLYRPRYKEWRPDLLIAKIIVPWACAWLFYFEEWLQSNDWKGGGEHPKSKD